MELFQELATAPLETIAPGIKRFIFTLNHVMCVYYEIDPGLRVAEHAHPHEQMGFLIQGKCLWRIQGQERPLEAPALYRIPSLEPHELESVGDERVLVLDIFSPIREDFLTGETPSYMR